MSFWTQKNIEYLIIIAVLLVIGLYLFTHQVPEPTCVSRATGLPVNCNY